MATQTLEDIQKSIAPEGLVGSPSKVIEFEARGAVSKLFECRADEVILSGPAGTGKSRGAIEYIHFWLSNIPKMRALFVRKTLVSLTESGLVTYKHQVLHELDGVHFYGGSKSEPAAFIYPNGSRLIVGGLDQVSKVMSTEYDMIYIQEANEVTEDEVERLTTRLRNDVLHFQQLVCDVNPQEPWHWILKRVHRGTMTMLESRHEDNPVLFNEDGTMTPRGEAYIRRLDSLTGVRLQRLRYGKWVAAEGVVFDAFDAAIHVIKPFKIPADWTRIRSIDFGFVNPFTCQWWAVDRDRRMYLYREIYRTGKLVSDHADRIKMLTGNKRIVATVADHDSEDRATLHAAGIRTVRARKSILPGIEAVQKRLRVDESGKAGLYIFNDSLVDHEVALTDRGEPARLAEEVVSYAWPSGDAQKSRVLKELPLDQNNHGCDAMRYAVMHLDKGYQLVAPGGSGSTQSKWAHKHERE